MPICTSIQSSESSCWGTFVWQILLNPFEDKSAPTTGAQTLSACNAAKVIFDSFSGRVGEMTGSYQVEGDSVQGQVVVRRANGWLTAPGVWEESWWSVRHQTSRLVPEGQTNLLEKGTNRPAVGISLSGGTHRAMAPTAARVQSPSGTHTPHRGRWRARQPIRSKE